MGDKKLGYYDNMIDIIIGRKYDHSIKYEYYEVKNYGYNTPDSFDEVKGYATTFIFPDNTMIDKYAHLYNLHVANKLISLENTENVKVVVRWNRDFYAKFNPYQFYSLLDSDIICEVGYAVVVPPYNNLEYITLLKSNSVGFRDSVNLISTIDGYIEMTYYLKSLIGG